jgi:hypothetical protein
MGEGEGRRPLPLPSARGSVSVLGGEHREGTGVSLVVEHGGNGIVGRAESGVPLELEAL